jgi:phage FluMu protein Com
MANLKGRVIPSGKIGTWGVVKPTFAGPVFNGDGPDDYMCLKCNHLLARGIDQAKFINLAIWCFECGTVNAISEKQTP